MHLRAVKPQVNLSLPRVMSCTNWTDGGVEIPQMAPRQVLTTIWRDLLQRYFEQFQGKTLRSVREGAVTDKPEEAESWYRLSLSDFSGSPRQ